MASPGQKRGGCGHLMAGFDTHSYCARCRDKGKGPDPCVENPKSTDCKFCSILTCEQRSQLSTPSYTLKKEKHEAKKDILTTPSKDTSHVNSVNPSLVDPASVSVISAVDGQGTLQSPGFSGPVEKQKKRRLQLPRPSCLQTSLQNLVQTVGRPTPLLMQRLQNSTRSGPTTLTDWRLYLWLGHWTANRPSNLLR